MSCYRATLAPQADADYRAIAFNSTKEAIGRLLRGEDPATVAADLEDTPLFGDDRWRFLRVNGYLLLYRPLAMDERRAIEDDAHVLVARMLPARDRL